MDEGSVPAPVDSDTVHVAIEVPVTEEENPNSFVREEVQEIEEQSESGSTADGSVLQLNLTGDALQKFLRILHEKGLHTAEDAVHYFYSLHNSSTRSGGKGEGAVGLSDVRPARKPGRPKGSRKKDVEQEEESEPEQISESSGQEPGTVVVDGVRKSTRQRRNPFVKTEYISVTAADLGNLDDSDINDEMEWSLQVDAADEFVVGSGEEDNVDIGDSQSQSEGASIPTPAIRIIQGKRRIVQLPPPFSKRRLTVNGKKVGRPRKRVKEAVLFKGEEETMNCGKCSEHFETLPALRAHKMQAHSRPNHPFFCEHCDYTAMFDCDMKRHQLVHSEAKQFRCETCDFSTNWERNLTLHMENVHSNKEPWICDRCDLKIYNHSKVKQHQLSHNPNAFKCSMCEFLFETKAKLEWHKNNMHMKDGEKLKCSECPYTSTTSVNMRVHLKNKHGVESRQREKMPRRKKQEMCNICNKRLINEEQKQVHMQIHEPNNRDSLKPYYCHVCDARCADVNQMVRHRAIHNEDKPFACKHCSYKTRWKKDLKTHEMIHTGVKNVRCPHCSYTCYTRQRLRAHLIKHDESRHHLCPLCNMAFKSKQALRMHTMYHTGDAAYSCDLCDFRTVTDMRLRKHKLRHTDERKYSCNLCGKNFKQPHHVTQHRDIVHLGKPSYRERKRIALQQSAAEALGSLNSSDINFGGGPTTYTVVNDDGTLTTAVVDLHTTTVQSAPRQDDTQYVMVETPTGYHYVAVVMPEDGQQGSDLQTVGLVGDGTQVSADTATLEDAQMILSQATDVYYAASGSVENGQAVDALVGMQPQ